MATVEIVLHIALCITGVLTLVALAAACGSIMGWGRTIAVGIAIAALAWLTWPTTAHADCRHFFYKQQVVQQAYVAPYVAPIVLAAPVYYSAGVEYQIEAAVERALRQREQAPLTKGYQSPQQAPIQAPVQAPKGTLAPLQQVSAGTFAKCARCHTGDKPAGGLTLDGRTPTTCENYRRFGEIFALHENIPVKMQGIVSSATPEEMGAMNESILRLVAQPVQPQPPLPDGGLQ